MPPSLCALLYQRTSAGMAVGICREADGAGFYSYSHPTWYSSYLAERRLHFPRAICSCVYPGNGTSSSLDSGLRRSDVMPVEAGIQDCLGNSGATRSRGLPDRGALGTL